MISDEILKGAIQRAGDTEWLAPIKEMATDLLAYREAERKANQNAPSQCEAITQSKLQAEIYTLKIENEALHTECDRLTAMLGPQRVLEAEEVTESGFYWWRGCNESGWNLVDVLNDREDFIMFTIGDDCDQELIGQFVGPLKIPEVRG